MSERTFLVENIEPVQLFGVNNRKFELIKKNFPELKLIARGNKIKIVGELKQINNFENKLNLLIEHFEKFGALTENHIERLLSEEGEEMLESGLEANGALVYGPGGLIIKAKTANQRKMVEETEKNDMLFAIGPAGTGKTYTAVAIAARALKNKEVKRIILTRPAVEAGEHLGFLPGDLKEKLDPYLQPLYDSLYDMIPAEKLHAHLENGVIQIAPLAFMRGRTLDNAFVILDEAQNATESQMKMFLTRMGPSAKFIVTGDMSQIDLPKKQPSGLVQAVKVVSNISGVSVVYLDEKDVIRHKLVKDILRAYDQMDEDN